MVLNVGHYSILDMLPTFPLVSVITPTYNRRKFIPYLIQCMMKQTYPLQHIEWIVLDDGSDPVGDLFTGVSKSIPKFRYIYENQKKNIGAKRNRLNRESTGEIIIAFDDDDFYPPERIQHVVHKFKQFPQVQLAGSSEIYMYYTDIQTIYKLGPYNQNHATNGTLAFRRAYAESHQYDEEVTHAEEKSFLDSYVNPMIQLDPYKVMLVISHAENTFNKKDMRNDNNPFVKKTALKVRNFIKDATLRAFYQGLT